MKHDIFVETRGTRLFQKETYAAHLYLFSPSIANSFGLCSKASMKLFSIIQNFEKQIPLALQDSWDQCGLQLGDPHAEVKSVLFAYDVCKETIATAKKKKCQLIVTHHPFRTKGDANIRLDTYDGQLIAQCIKNDIAIYTSHTNHDNSEKSASIQILERLGLNNIQPLQPAQVRLFKLAVGTPLTHCQKVREALFKAGAGTLGNYSECSFSTNGTGTFKGNEWTTPAVGKKLIRESVKEEKIEVLVKEHDLPIVISKMLTAHPYEEVAYDIYPLENKMTSQGAGAVGQFDRPIKKDVLIQKLKSILNISTLRFVASDKQSFKRIAICTGSGTHLLDTVIAQKADLFITGDVKYHQAIHAKRHNLAVADVGHFASEQESVEILREIFEKQFKRSLKYSVFKGLKDPFETV